MRIALVPVLLLAACASTPSPAGTATSPADALESYYPLAVGNSWTYETRFGKRVERNTVTIVGEEGGYFHDDQRGRLTFDADGLRDPSRYLIRRPLRRGASWRSIVDVGKSNRFDIVDTSARVTVPAGTFHDVLVVRGIDDSVPGGEMEIVSSYAPGVGLIRVEQTMIVGKAERIPQMTISLVSYRLR
jgi:hypothetical protein